MLTGNVDAETPCPPDTAERNIIPLLTDLFIEGLRDAPPGASGWGAPVPADAKGGTERPSIFRVPLAPPAAHEDAARHQPARRKGEADHGRSRAVSRSRDIRYLIRFLSHRYNNLLMAVWGNITLVRMALPDDHPLLETTRRMETLIQSGAFMTHMVLGYLGERRAVAKRLRLNQLLQELRLTPADGRPDDTASDLEARLKNALRRQTPAVIAEAAARVMAWLFASLQQHLQVGAPAQPPTGPAREKWAVIAQLTAQGLALAQEQGLAGTQEAI